MTFLLGSAKSILLVEENSDQVMQRPVLCPPEEQPLRCLAASLDRSRVLAGLFEGGLFLSADQGQTWSDISGDLPNRNIHACAFDPADPERIYVGTNPPAMFVTTDRGAHWRELESLRAHPNAATWSNPRGPAQVRSIAISPLNSNVIFAGVEVGDLLKSEDGGKSWRPLDGVCHDQHKVLLSSSDPKLVFLMTGEDSQPYDGRHGYGFFVSRDGGETWQNPNQTLHTDKYVYCEDALVSPDDTANTLFVAISDRTPPHWRGPRKPNEYFVAPAKERREKGADVSIHRSRDAGRTWENLSNRGLPASLFDAVWGLDARGSSVYFGTTGGQVWASNDGGDSWRTLPAEFPRVSHLVLMKS
jgi:photosystem II stability/assembly factor-like uncharacterized protein